MFKNGVPSAQGLRKASMVVKETVVVKRRKKKRKGEGEVGIVMKTS